MTLSILCHFRDGFATSLRKYTGCARSGATPCPASHCGAASLRNLTCPGQQLGMPRRQQDAQALLQLRPEREAAARRVHRAR